MGVVSLTKSHYHHLAIVVAGTGWLGAAVKLAPAPAKGLPIFLASYAPFITCGLDYIRFHPATLSEITKMVMYKSEHI